MGNLAQRISFGLYIAAYWAGSDGNKRMAYFSFGTMSDADSLRGQLRIVALKSRFAVRIVQNLEHIGVPAHVFQNGINREMLQLSMVWQDCNVALRESLLRFCPEL